MWLLAITIAIIIALAALGPWRLIKGFFWFLILSFIGVLILVFIFKACIIGVEQY
jgi:hypothetical protein